MESVALYCESCQNFRGKLVDEPQEHFSECDQVLTISLPHTLDLVRSFVAFLADMIDPFLAVRRYITLRVKVLDVLDKRFAFNRAFADRHIHQNLSAKKNRT